METLQISLAAARVNAQMKQSDVANRLHVSKTTVMNWEQGKVSPSFFALKELSAIYQIPMDNLFLPEEAT